MQQRGTGSEGQTSGGRMTGLGVSEHVVAGSPLPSLRHTGARQQLGSNGEMCLHSTKPEPGEAPLGFSRGTQAARAPARARWDPCWQQARCSQGAQRLWTQQGTSVTPCAQGEATACTNCPVTTHTSSVQGGPLHTAPSTRLLEGREWQQTSTPAAPERAVFPPPPPHRLPGIWASMKTQTRGRRRGSTG